jgi:hypothetical protein
MLLAVLLAAPSAQSLEDQGRDLMDTLQFRAALDKLEQANQLEPTPERLLAIAQCHRVLAWQSAREAVGLRSEPDSDPVWRALARTLAELDKARTRAPLRDRTELTTATVVPLDERVPPAVAPQGEPTAAAPLGQQVPPAALPAVQSALPGTRQWGFFSAIGAGGLLAGAVLTQLSANSLADSLNDPGTTGAAKADAADRSKMMSTVSKVMVGAALAVGVMSAVLLLHD